MKIAITGASGFIGQALTSHLAALGHQVTALVRRPIDIADVRSVLIEDITTVNASHIDGQNVIIHLAGVAHDNDADRNRYHRVNVIGTEAVTRACVQSGAQRLIYLSSVKVHGDASSVPVNAGTPLQPADDYGRSRIEAEQIVLAQSLLDPIVVRVPLVYGKGVKGNFATLVKLVKTGLPLPFASVTARRSYLGIDNLLALFALCANSDKLGSQVLYGCDPAPCSLPEMLQLIGQAMDRKVKLFALPAPILRFAASLALGGKRADKLFNQLEVDLTGTQRLTGWTPQHGTAECLQRMFGHPD